MTAVITIFILAVGGMLALVFFKPAVHVGQTAISIFWVAPAVGALALLPGGHLTLGEMWAGLAADSAVNPLKILVLFFAMTLMSVFLDEVGFFRYLASAVLKRAKTSQKMLFLYLYLAVSVLTVFTSNDIVVLTFTPFICYFAKNAEIDPLPYLIGEFVAANTWSMALIIGNPTNIYLAAGNGVGFADYIKVMLLPTALGGAVSFAVLWLLFSKRLSAPMQGKAPDALIHNKPAVGLGVLALGGCIVFLVLSSYLNMPMWLIAAGFCLFLYAAALVMLLLQRRSLLVLRRSLLRAPLDVIPFVLSMFILVLALDRVGATAAFAALLAGKWEIFTYGGASLLAANFVNNIPMSVLFSSVVSAAEGVGVGALYAAVIGSNVGAFLTPVGALAGIMWMAMLKEHGVKLSFGRFVLYGVAVALPTMLAALLGLCLTV
jgi:arsenical pump membrane protein